MDMESSISNAINCSWIFFVVLLGILMEQAPIKWLLTMMSGSGCILPFCSIFISGQPDMKSFGLGLDLPDQEVTGSLSYMNEQNMDTYNMRMKL